MAKKILCVVLSIMMLMSTFAFASSAAQYDYYPYTVEEAEAEVAECGWYVDYDASVDYKDLIDRTFLTGAQFESPIVPAVAAEESVRERNLYFWKDEIIEAYHNPDATNEDYCDLYNKMKTPLVGIYEYEEDGELVREADIFYDTVYFYRDESKGIVDVEFVADKEYAKPGDIITVDVYVKTNFITMVFAGGFFYDKTLLTPLTVAVDLDSQPTWMQSSAQLDHTLILDSGASTGIDRRNDFWPKSMYTPENLEKYGVSYVMAQADVVNYPSNYLYSRMLDGSRMFTATFQVKEDAPEGAVLDFFMTQDCEVNTKYSILEQENSGRNSIYTFNRNSVEGGTPQTNAIVVDTGVKYDHTFNITNDSVTIGEEPTPAVKGEVVDVTTEPGTIGENVPVSVEVTGAPESIRLVAADESATTYTRDDAAIVATDAGEIWTIDVFAAEAEATYDVYASYGDLGWTDEAVQVTVTATKAVDLTIHSIEVPDMEPDGQNGGVILAGKHDVIIKTSTDVTKIQFLAADGGTYTYGTHAANAENPYVDVDGERIWTISHAFGPYGDQSLVIRTRCYTTFFAATNSTLDATVVY